MAPTAGGYGIRHCPVCGNPIRYIYELDMYYCNHCQEYLDNCGRLLKEKMMEKEEV